MEPRDCYFCDGRMVNTHYDLSATGRPGVGMQCEKCGASGPHADIESAAIAAYNQPRADMREDRRALISELWSIYQQSAHLADQLTELTQIPGNLMALTASALKQANTRTVIETARVEEIDFTLAAD